jgi:hypothetical protein
MLDGWILDAGMAVKLTFGFKSMFFTMFIQKSLSIKLAPRIQHPGSRIYLTATFLIILENIFGKNRLMYTPQTSRPPM